MKLINEINGTVLRSGIVAPVTGGSVAGVCPQAAFRRVDALAFLGAISLTTAGDAGMVAGHRTWSPLIT